MAITYDQIVDYVKKYYPKHSKLHIYEDHVTIVIPIITKVYVYEIVYVVPKKNIEEYFKRSSRMFKSFKIKKSSNSPP